MMWLKEIIWIERYKLKIEKKHNVTIEEVEDVLTSKALFCRANRGRVKGEDVYVAYGRTKAGQKKNGSITMPRKAKKIPEEFKTYEDAAEFWDTHDSTDFLDELEEVEMKVKIQRRHYLIELDINTAELLQESARKKGIPISFLANELLQKQLAEAE